MSATLLHFEDNNRQRLAAEQGANFSYVYTWRDANGALINLTGYTAKMQIRASKYSRTFAAEFLSSASQIILGGVLGTITISVAASVMTAIDDGVYLYELEVTSAGGVVSRVIEGRFQVKRDICI